MSPVPPRGLVVAIVGAESTGKTTLAGELALQLQRVTGLDCGVVDEWLRAWCLREGRTPRPGEQAGIAQTQRARIEAAALAHDIVIADTTPLMTAVYSALLFGDEALRAEAVAWQRSRCGLTLLTATDLPWQSEPGMRDGPHVREPVDALLRGWMAEAGIGWARVGGSGPARVQAALAAVLAVAAPIARARSS